MPLIGGRYQILDPLGRGGFGEVFRCKDTLTGQQVAVKVLPPRARGRPLQEELAALYGAAHAGVVELLDDGVDGGRPYLVMRLVEGTPFPGGSTPAPWAALRAPTTALLCTLGALHGRELYHLDLKPEHVRVQGDGSIILLDLGLSAGPAVSALRGQAPLGGTRRYAAPEQILGRKVGAATDLYAVGVMLYEALTGLLPQEAQHGPQLEAQRVRRSPVPLRDRRPDLPAQVAAGVDALVAGPATARPASAWDALDLLDLSLPEPRLADGTLDRAALEALCAGPRLLLHIPEDAAGELERRTGGRAALVREELRAWVRTGLATPREDGVGLSRDAVDRLLAGDGALPTDLPPLAVEGDAAALLDAIVALWPRASATGLVEALRWPMAHVDDALGGLGPAVLALPSGLLRPAARPQDPVLTPRTSPAPRTMAQLTARAWHTHQDGRSAAAITALRRALAHARHEADAIGEGEVLRCWARVAVSQGSASALRAAHYETLRALGSSPALSRAAALLEAAVRAVSGEPARALDRLAELDLAADLELSAARIGVLLIAAERAGADQQAIERALAEARRWAEALDTPAARAQVLAWEGRRAYVEGRYTDAAHHCLDAMPHRDSATGLLSSLVNAAAALLELGELDRCGALAEDAAARAAAQRLSRFEALAVQLARAAAWRAGLRHAPDPELVQAALSLDDPGTAGPIALTEAAFAWRAGDLDQAAALAREAVGCFLRVRNQPGQLLAEALDARCVRDPARASALAQRVVETPLPDFDWQILGMVLPIALDAPAGWREVAIVRAREAERPTLRRELLSPVEALLALEASQARA